MHYKVQYANSTQRIPEFPIAPEIALELLMASNFSTANFFSPALILRMKINLPPYVTISHQ